MIDAHQHLWQIGKNDCVWPTADLTAIYRDFSPTDLALLARAAGVTGTVLVQSQESDADTDYILRLASTSELIKAVVGWVDLSSEAAVSRIAELAQHPKLRGLRPMLQGLPKDDWILNGQNEPAIAEMQRCNLVLDALIHVRHLPYLHIFACRHSQLPIIIDHAAKPNIAAGEFDIWAEAIAPLAKSAQVYCKISGLLTEAGAGQGLDQLSPYVSRLYHLFGADRLMWGSDWPVLNLAPNSTYAGYRDWLEAAKKLLPMISHSESEAIFGQTARRVYGF